jgi:hypothetical protein
MTNTTPIRVSVSLLLLLAVFFCFWLPSDTAEAQSQYFPYGLATPLQFGEVYEGYEPPDSTKGISVGPFNFRPGVQLNGTYTDNVYLSNQNKKSGFLLSVDPSFDFTLSKDLKLKEYVSFGYNGDIGSYLNVNNYNPITHTVWTDINFLKRTTTYLRLRESLTYTDNSYGSQEFIGQGVMNRRMLNQADFVLGRNLPGAYSVEINYQNAWENYFAAAYSYWSSVTNTLAPTLLYELTGKTKLLAQYSFGLRSFYDMPSDVAASYAVQTLTGGLRMDASSRLSGQIQLGYAIRRYANDYSELGLPYINNSEPMYQGNLTYIVSPKTRIGVSASRMFLAATDLSTIAIIPQSITRNAFTLTVDTAVRKRLTLTVAGTFYLDEYPAEGSLFGSGTDRWYNAGVYLRHQFGRYFYWGLGYQFQKRDSQFYGNYTANNITASIAASY